MADQKNTTIGIKRLKTTGGETYPFMFFNGTMDEFVNTIQDKSGFLSLSSIDNKLTIISVAHIVALEEVSVLEEQEKPERPEDKLLNKEEVRAWIQPLQKYLEPALNEAGIYGDDRIRITDEYTLPIVEACVMLGYSFGDKLHDEEKRDEIMKEVSQFAATRLADEKDHPDLKQEIISAYVEKHAVPA